ncbi:DUF1080 domain-containing protein [bacterium]|nr:DUF1080 domain-containing protein [bacterium]
MRLAITILLISLIVTSTWAGTFRDDFNDGDFKGWMTPLGGEWSVEDGVVVCKNSDNAVVLSIGEPEWENYTVTFDSKVESHSGMFALGGMIRRDEVEFNEVYYCIAHTLVGDDRIEAGITVAKRPVEHSIKRNHNFSLKLGKWYNFRVTLKGTRFDFFLDNELVISTDYNNYPIPKSGKFSIWNRWTDKVYFDNVVITGDDIQPVQAKSKLTTTWGRVRSGKH